MITNSPSIDQKLLWRKALGRDIPKECAWLCNDTTTVCFFNYSTDDIELAIHSNGFFGRDFITHCFRYIYNQLKVSRSTVRVVESNQPSIKLVTGLGYQLEGILREAVNGENVLIFGMLHKECRWIDGQEKPTKSSRTT